ncbi:MAG: M50 family metallopeptidase, partial [Terriglobales bacterium]
VLGGAMAVASLALIGANVFQTGFQGFFSFLWGIAISGFLVWAGWKWKPGAANILLLFLAVQTALNSVSSLIGLAQYSLGFVSGNAWTDATNMAQMTGIPAGFWAVFWVACSLALVGFTMWRTYGFAQKKA